MRVTHLSLGDFRNYRVAEVGFDGGLNLIIGRNGQGKTNLVEAVSYFSNLSSHRVTGDSALIRAGSDAAVLRMRVAVGERDVLLEAQLNRNRPNRAQLNRNAVRPRELTRWFSCVLFAPEDLSLVKGDPSVRRRFLDDSVTARNPAFAGVISDYERVVRQRTALLKSAHGKADASSVESTLAIWDEQLVSLGTRIMLARRELVAALTVPLTRAYESIVENDHSPRIALTESVAGNFESRSVSRETKPADRSGLRSDLGESVSRETLPKGNALEEVPADVSRETLAEEFREALRARRRQEIERGVTLIGPHRDDALFELNELPVKGFASHGESWSYALSLRLAVAELLREESPSGDPVIILDDVFAELDSRRRNALMTQVSRFEQVIVTAAVEGDVPAGEWRRVQVRGGAIVEGGDIGGQR